MHELLTARQAAEVFGIPTSTLRTWCERGLLIEGTHYIHPEGTQRRYVRRALRQWLFTPRGNRRRLVVPDRPTPINMEALR